MMEQQTILFMVTNGIGLGHLTRGLAVARRIKKLKPDVEIIFLTTSLATEVIRENGFKFFYVPTQQILPPTMTGPLWNEYLKRQLEEVISIYQPHTLIYDGGFPYGKVLSCLRYMFAKSIWIKRECYKQGCTDLKSIERLFSCVIIPNELSREQKTDTLYHYHCEPIMLLDQDEVHDREKVRAALGVKADEILFYVQLGAGRINEIKDIVSDVIKEIIKNKKHHVLLGESIIGEHMQIHLPQVTTIRSYPNAQYFKGVDVAISAAGYNTFHELLYFGVPTLFIPNKKTTMDDQWARVKKAESQNGCLCLNEVSEAGINQKLNELLANRQEIGSNAAKIIYENGAMEAAKYILDFIS